MNNPYTSRGPLQDSTLFCGRTDELNEIGSLVQGNQSVSLVGPRKIGKTSLMQHLMRPEIMNALQLGDENLFVYIDCQALTDCGQDEIFAHLCTEAAAALRARDLDPDAALKAAASKPSRPAFEGALRRLNERGLRVIFVVDEFEQLTLNPQVNVNLYNELRSAAGRLRLVFITASAEPLIELTYSNHAQTILSSPFFNIFAQLPLGLLCKADASVLIRKPMEAGGIVVSPQLEDFIYQLVGGHPLALQIACFHAWENPKDLPLMEQRTMEELQGHFQYYWHHLSSAERQLLRDPSDAALREAGDPILRRILRDLTRKCLLVHTPAAYAYPSKAWAEFVSAQPDDAPTSVGARQSATIGSDGEPGPTDTSRDETEAVDSPRGPRTRKNTILQVIRESLPTMVGRIGAALVIAVAGLVYMELPALLEKAKGFGIKFNPTSAALAVVGIAALAGVFTWAALSRRPSKTAKGTSPRRPK